jgi:hypothetical protein
MATELRLVPSQAAESIAARLKTIEQCRAIIVATVERYDGLKAFEAELEARGIKDAVDQLMKQEG